jgi:hypothetical protein
MRVHEMFVLILGLFIIGLLTLVPTMVISGQGGIGYTDLVLIILAAVTVVLAALAIGLGGLALWGYKEFMTKADESAKKVAESTTDTYLKNPEFRDTLRQLAREISSRRGEGTGGFRGCYRDAAAINGPEQCRPI